MEWENYDILALISIIAGIILIVIPMTDFTTAIIVGICGGAAVTILGIIALLNDSKLGIFGVMCGSLVIMVAILVLI